MKLRSYLNEKKIYFLGLILIEKEKEIKQENENIFPKQNDKFNEFHKFEKYLKNLKDTKLSFLLQIKNSNYERIKVEEKVDEVSLQFNKNTQELIDCIFTFLKSDFLETKNLIKKINFQNAKVLNKESFLIFCFQ